MSKRPGYIAISRKAFESDVWWTEPRVFSKWEAWEDLIQSAAWRSGTRREMPHGTVTLKRGEVVVSRRTLAQRWSWSEKAVRTFLAEAVKRARIEARKEARSGTVYVIVNYDTYQPGHVVSGPQAEPELGRQKGPPSNSEVKHQEKTPAGWVAEFGQMWAVARKAVANYGRIGKALKPLVEREGVDAARAAWAVFVSSPSAKFGAEWFAENAGDFQPREETRLMSAGGNPILSIAEFREQQRRDLEEINKLRVARGEAPIAVA